MADIADAFFRGQAAGRAQIAHKEQLEENKLRMQQLKHEIEGLKIADQIRARALAAENLKFLHGQDEHDLPSDPDPSIVRQHEELPEPQALEDVVRNMVSDRVTSTSGQPMLPEAPKPIEGPMQAPEATPGVIGRRPHAVSIPGVEAFGGAPATPGVSVRPQSLQDLMRAEFAAKMNEPYNLPADATRMVGTTVVAHGAPRTSATARDTLVPTAGPNGTSIYTPQSRAAGMEVGRAPARATTDPERPSRLLYDAFNKSYMQAHRVPTAAEVTAQTNRQYEDPSLPNLPVPPAPPSYAKWKEMTEDERLAVLGNPALRITDAEVTARRTAREAKPTAATPKPSTDPTVPSEEIATFLKGQTPPDPTQATRYVLTDGSVWDVLPDGTIKPGPRQ